MSNLGVNAGILRYPNILTIIGRGVEIKKNCKICHFVK